MKRYKDWAPTGFDRKGAFVEDRDDWLVAPVIRTRDSQPIDDSNFDAFLEGVGGEREHVEVHRFNHWGPGWIEIILISPEDPDAVHDAELMSDALSRYPVLDESDLSAREYEDFLDSWDSWGRREFVAGLRTLLRKHYIARSAHGYCAEELADAVVDICDDRIDEIWRKSIKLCGWEYEHEGSGCRINISGALLNVPMSQLVRAADAALWEAAVKADIVKLCRLLGASKDAEGAAVAGMVTTVSGIKGLVQKYPV